MIGVVARGEERDIVREFFELFKTPWEFSRDDVYYDVLLCADDALDRRSSQVVIVYGSKARECDRKTNVRSETPRHNTTLSWRGERIPVYGDCVTVPSDGETRHLVLEDTGESVLSVTRVGSRTIVRVGYDLFREIGFLLTMGQPTIHAGIPTLERHIALLRDLIVNAGVPLIEIPPIPEGFRFTVCLTHDVDHPSIRLHKCDHTLFGFLYRAVAGSVIDVCRGRKKLATVGRNWAAVLRLPFVHLGLAKDFWSQFERYLEIEKGLGSTFFVIPIKKYAGRSGEGQAPSIRASSYGVSDIADHVGVLRGAGCEIGLHGIDAWLDSAKGLEERERVSLVAGASVMGVRMHWLYFDERAPERLDQAGFTYDSTFGYNETVGLRAGTMQAFKPLSAGRLLELPLSIMDTALFYPSRLNLTPKAASRAVSRLVDDAERYGGVLTINWHDRSLAPERLWGEFYIELLDDLKRKSAWFPTAAQAAGWFSQRRSAVFGSVRPEGDSVRITVSADLRRDLPALTLRVHWAEPSNEGRPLLARRPTRFSDMALSGSLDSHLVSQQ